MKRNSWSSCCQHLGVNDLHSFFTIVSLDGFWKLSQSQSYWLSTKWIGSIFLLWTLQNFQTSRSVKQAKRFDLRSLCLKSCHYVSTGQKTMIHPVSQGWSCASGSKVQVPNCEVQSYQPFWKYINLPAFLLHVCLDCLAMTFFSIGQANKAVKRS